MALAQIIDLDERRRARVSSAPSTPPATTIAPAMPAPMWLVWMPVYFWYVA